MNGGQIIAQVLQNHGVQYLFTLCGGHIAPIYVEAENQGIQVIDVRDEASAVFAADAIARLTGIPGVAAVTAGPGVTNTITALKNAQMAQSPLLLLGGATATLLRNRGALQDIDQMALVKPHVKWATIVKRRREIVPALNQAMRIARSGVPGPVFVELPVDLLYNEETVREWYGKKSNGGGSLLEKAVQWYINRHVNGLFSGMSNYVVPGVEQPFIPTFTQTEVNGVTRELQSTRRPQSSCNSSCDRTIQKNRIKLGTINTNIDILSGIYLNSRVNGQFHHIRCSRTNIQHRIIGREGQRYHVAHRTGSLSHSQIVGTRSIGSSGKACIIKSTITAGGPHTAGSATGQHCP